MIVSYFALATIEFFLINWLGGLTSFSGYYHITFIQSVEDSPLFNIVFRVLAPVVFLILAAALWYAVGFATPLRHFWLVTVIYFGLRWAYNLAMSRARLVSWPRQVITGSLAIALSFIVSQTILAHRAALLPSRQGLTDQLWIVVIGFLYLTAQRISWPQLGSSPEERRQAFLRARYHRAKGRFGDVIKEHSSNRGVEVVAYAIMIYESFNRPPIYQWLERTVLFSVGMASTLGPMQVRTPVRLSSVDLVKRGVQEVNRLVKEAFETFCREEPVAASVLLRRDPDEGIEVPFTSDFDMTRVRFEDLTDASQEAVVARAAAKYNIRSDYPAQIAAIFSFLRKQFYPDLTPRVGAG